MKLHEIAAYLNGTLSGDGDTEISGVAGISEAAVGDITFLADPKLLAAARHCPATAVIVGKAFPELAKPQVVVANPQWAFARLLSRYYPQARSFPGISEQAFIASSASVGASTTIYPFVYIAAGARIGSNCILYPGVYVGEESSVGNDTIIYPNVTVRERIMIGNRVILQSGAVIGADGFGYVFEGGQHQKIPQVGSVNIGDDVEIGANATIDRATTGTTVIGSGTKIDNLVQVGHNVTIGSNSIVVAQTGIAGSCTIGDGVIIAAQVGIADHVTIASGATLGARTGVMKSLDKGVYLGEPAMPYRDYMKIMAVFTNLVELRKKVLALEERLASAEPDKEKQT